MRNSLTLGTQVTLEMLRPTTISNKGPVEQASPTGQPLQSSCPLSVRDVTCADYPEFLPAPSESGPIPNLKPLKPEKTQGKHGLTNTISKNDRPVFRRFCRNYTIDPLQNR